MSPDPAEQNRSSPLIDGDTPARPAPVEPGGPGSSGLGRDAVGDALTQAYHRHWTAVVAATVRAARDLDLAEECAQEAYAAAVTAWQRDGVPHNPAAWLTTTARRRAIDTIRRAQTLRSKLPLVVEPNTAPESVEDAAMDRLDAQAAAELGEAAPSWASASGNSPEDDQLRLIFLCCHPALAADGQVALTMRLVCGVQTPDIAAAFLVSESTMAARLTRAKKKIIGSRIAFRIPSGAELPDRLASVLAAVFLMFTTGHTAPSGAELTRPQVSASAIRLGRALHRLMPDDTEVAGLLALMLVTDARRDTRTTESGRLLQLHEQDRTRWDRDQIAEADALIVAALRLAHGFPGRYTLQAAIAALYAEPAGFEQTDWPQILYLYDQLLQIWPSPIVALNRLVPLSYATTPAIALDQLTTLEADDRLDTYPYLPAIKGNLLTRLGRVDDAAVEYRRARGLTGNQAERDFLTHLSTWPPDVR